MEPRVFLSAIFSIIFVIGTSEGLGLYRNKGYANITENPGELCARSCNANDKRICYFKFVLEYYQAMGVACGKCAKGNLTDCNKPQCIAGDGVEKGVMSINREVPGPAIQVCKGDKIIVDVVNNAHGSAAAIHWHGMHMKETPFMDGVPFVTQCPISFANTFRYWFDAVEPGTHFYHSHSGHHKINGQYGALIVREPDEEVPNIDEYDYDLPEHNIVISDWMHVNGEQLFPGLPSIPTGADSLLINGRGSYIDPKTYEHKNVPARIFLVKPGKRYRFRIINSISHAFPARLQIEGHSFKVIASDSFNVGPMEFDTVTSNSGERYDIVLTANHTEGDYWIRVRAMGQKNPIEAFALLRYESGDPDADAEITQPEFPDYNDTFASNRILNDPSATCNFGTDNCCVTELSGLDDDEELRTKEPDQKVFVAFNNIQVPNADIFQPGSYPHFQNPLSYFTFVGALNNISLTFPASPPLTQPSDVDESEFCDEDNLPAHCEGKLYCSCIHRIKIKLGSIVELVVVDESTISGNFHHPFHLHGHRFMVMGLGHHPSHMPMKLAEARRIESSEGLERHFKNIPPFKDTISIPNRGYAVLRFRAYNPGYWLMHCHYEWHLASGMGVIIQVGDKKQMVKPPADFPKCQNYMPKVSIRRN